MSFAVTILGSSGAVPAHGRFPSSHFVAVDNHCYLIDCGEGTQLQLMRLQLPFHRIDHIFITHLHGDHYLGLMGLLFTLHLQQRSRDLHLYSPPGLDEILTLQLRHSRSALCYKIVYHPLHASRIATIHQDEKLQVDTIPLHHKIDCCGFLFREIPKPRRIDKSILPEDILLQHIVQLKAGKDVFDESGELLYKNEAYTLPPRPSLSYAYCSDTRYQPELAKQLNGVDVLYHEATFASEHQDKANETLHSTAREAAMTARASGVKQLLIGHFSARYRELEPLLEEAREVFPRTRLAIDGETFDLGQG